MKREKLTRAVLSIGRLTHRHEGLDAHADDYDADTMVKPLVVTVADGANVVSSLLTNGKHAPAIDLDVPVVLVPSSTRGHHHLYLDAELSWGEYKRLLRVMQEVGLIEPGFYSSALRRGSTLLRLPHVLKS